MDRILIVEDEAGIRDILNYTISNEGYEVISCGTGKEALNVVEEFKPNLIIVDLMLPDISGFNLCRVFSTSYPIIIISAKNDMVDKLNGLTLGASDYITKPFDIREVLLRIKSVLKRNSSEVSSEIEKLIINTSSRKVYKNGDEIKLKPKEFDLLSFLNTNRNIVFKRVDLLDRLWGYDYEGDIRTVDIHVRRLRAKLDNENEDSIIETVFGVGYVMR